MIYFRLRGDTKLVWILMTVLECIVRIHKSATIIWRSDMRETWLTQVLGQYYLFHDLSMNYVHGHMHLYKQYYIWIEIIRDIGGGNK